METQLEKTFEIPIIEFVLCIIMVLMIAFMIGCLGSFLTDSGFWDVPFIHRFFRGRGTLYTTGYENGLKHKMIYEYDLKRNRKIKRIEKKLERVQNQYDELFLNFQKYKFQMENKESC